MTPAVRAVLRAVAECGGYASPRAILDKCGQPNNDPLLYLARANTMSKNDGVHKRLLTKFYLGTEVYYEITAAGRRALRREEKGK